MVRIDRVTDGTISHSSEAFYIFDCRFYILHIIQRIKYAHDIQSRFYWIVAKAFNNLIGIRIVTKQVTPAWKGRQLRGIPYRSFYFLQPLPGIFSQISHDRIGHSTTPYFHRIKTCFSIKRKHFVYLFLWHSRRKSRLLTIPESQIPNQKFSYHT